MKTINLDLPNNPTNEDALNYMLRRTFPKSVFTRSRDIATLTEAIHMSQEWLKKPYPKEALEKEAGQERKAGYISIDDAMSVFDDFMCGDVDEEGMETFLKMLKDKAESEDKENGRYI